MDNCPITGYVMDNDSIRTAVTTWFADQSAAELRAHRNWGVTDMPELFIGRTSFNEDIGVWDTSGVSVDGRGPLATRTSVIGRSGVTTMREMFDGASSFVRIFGWCVENVNVPQCPDVPRRQSVNQDISQPAIRDAYLMFHHASAFDQDLGWCVDEGVEFDTWGLDTPRQGVLWHPVRIRRRATCLNYYADDAPTQPRRRLQRGHQPKNGA